MALLWQFIAASAFPNPYTPSRSRKLHFCSGTPSKSLRPPQPSRNNVIPGSFLFEGIKRSQRGAHLDCRVVGAALPTLCLASTLLIQSATRDRTHCRDGARQVSIISLLTR